MSVLQGFRLSLKLDFIHDRFLHSSYTSNKKTHGLTMNFLFFLFPICMWFIHTKQQRKLPRHWAPVCYSSPFSPETSPRALSRILQDNTEVSTSHNVRKMKRGLPEARALGCMRQLRESQRGPVGPGFKANQPHERLGSVERWIKGSSRWQKPAPWWQPSFEALI